MNVAIVGSRGFAEGRVIRAAIERLASIHPDLTIVSGGAQGADSIAAFWARELSLPTLIHRPDWDRLGKRAGFERNKLIVRDADMVLAFYAPGPRSRGTSHTVDLAEQAGKELHVYHEGRWNPPM